jgi:hypothetical protein
MLQANQGPRIGRRTLSPHIRVYFRGYVSPPEIRAWGAKHVHRPTCLQLYRNIACVMPLWWSENMCQ